MKKTDERMVGHYYWAIPANDPDSTETWESEEQPARLAGLDEWGEPNAWQWLGVDGVSDWPAIWIGPEVQLIDREVSAGIKALHQSISAASALTRGVLLIARRLYLRGIAAGILIGVLMLGIAKAAQLGAWLALGGISIALTLTIGCAIHEYLYAPKPVSDEEEGCPGG
jgi:hypothetical protein